MKQENSRLFLFFLLVVAVTLFTFLDSWGFTETSEARYAEISKEMVETGDYLNPQLLGIYHYHKPPVAYYLTAIGYKIFGFNEFGARFFLQLFLLFQLILVYKIVEYLYNDKKLALLSAACYFTMPILVMANRNLTTDIFLTTFILAAINHWLLYITRRSGTWNLYVYYLMMGIAFETKGPVVFIFLWSFTIIYRIIHKEKFKLTIHQVLGFLLFLMVGSAWYVLVILEKPELLDYFLFKQTVNRIANKSFHRDQPFWFYIPILIGVLFPYVIAIFPKIKNVFQKSKSDKLLIYNIIFIVLLFSIFKTKRIFYVLPSVWMIAILVVRCLKISSPKIIKSIRISYIVLTTLYVIGCLILFFINIENITISVMQLTLVLILFGIFIALYQKYFRKQNYPSVIAMGCLFFGILIISGSLFMKNNRDLINSFKPIVTFINNESDAPNKKVFAFDYLISSVPFYTDSEFYTVNYLHDTTVREVQFQDDEQYKEYLLNVYLKSEATRFEELLNSGKNYVLVKKKFGVYKPFQFIEEKLPNKKDFGKWILYYN
ncbi:4-amino-4-deoxy-L-arabinose transferase [Pustulibacterium marinum]|uniref:4-amino-4-deoxy-L-arabinose transferase n=1 Tax=Pustulibacterium marinum TaxID=1224947 RepID=A0A1I7IL82_9FLAO|nr:glycosyltransferase family 39 protein [Pustulibacterium marinum]SFU73711.1 4-amino-4-deoxy-L-arabinose transferase [Pustulibacterium marinum]